MEPIPSAVIHLSDGFARAVTPIAAGTIVTDTAGLIAGEVSIPAGDRDIPAYRARPSAGGTFPVVLVVQEIFGVHEHIKDIRRRLAKAGYLAVAPELYVRQGDVSRLSDIQEIIKIVMTVPDSQVMSDLDATAAWAVKESNGSPTQLAITGFCYGGRITWLYAAHHSKLNAAVAWYGRLDWDRTPLWPKFPIDIAADLQAPVLGLYGGQDSGIPMEHVQRMQTALQAANSSSEIFVYPDAQHGFHADYRPSYHPEAAKDGWQKLLAWFKKYGV